MKLQTFLIISISAFIGFFTAKYFNEEGTQQYGYSSSCVIQDYYGYSDLDLDCVERRYGLPSEEEEQTTPY